MPSEWTTSHGVDLHLALDGGTGRRAALEEALRSAVRAGRLAPGTELPSTRALARDLAVARGTVIDAYDQLVAEGWLTARRGSGTAVAWAPLASARPRERAAAPPAGVPRHDFRPGSPDVSVFPRREWLAALRRALRDATDASLAYTDTRGLAPVRETIAGYVARARGVRTDAERVVVCSGFAQALSLLATALHDLGATAVAMENPCITSYRATAVRAGLDVHLLQVDDIGADPAGLDGEVGAAFLTPAHQYPMGVTLAPHRRSAFTEWARRHGTYVVEDDYDGEFRYDRQPVGALQGMDPERIAYVGTTSKSLAPGLRVGWIVLPPSLLDPVVAAKELADRQAGVLDQLALAELIDNGGMDRHIRRSRLRYRRRRDAVVAHLAAVPRVTVQGIAAGLHVVIGLPDGGPSEPEVVAHLAGGGVAVHGLGQYWHRPGRRPAGLVVGHGTPAEHAFPAAVDALATGLADLYR